MCSVKARFDVLLQFFKAIDFTVLCLCIFVSWCFWKHMLLVFVVKHGEKSVRVVWGIVFVTNRTNINQLVVISIAMSIGTSG
jgi:hypothetical protein